ncbi:MAG: tetratricopeptide repeat protein, partial [Desulfomonile sp.]|nr:tetratricopeptide repeat protein [Desulfomonile sp.]
LAVYLAVRTNLLRRPAIGYAFCAALFICGLLSKENSFTLPLVLLLVEIILLRENRQGIALRAVVLSLILLVCVGLSHMLQHPHGKEQLGAGILETLALYYRESGVTLAEVILTQCRVLFRYAALIIIPLPSSMLLTSPQVISRSLVDPAETLPAVIAAVILIALGFLLIRKRPVASFGVLFFLVNLVPEAILVPQYSFFAYRAVLPMLGVILVLADIGRAAVEKLSCRAELRLVRAVLVGLATAAVLFVAGVTSIRATIWSDNVHFWREAVDNLPPLDGRVERLPAIQALNNLGVALMKRGRYLEAAQTYENVLKLEPTDPRKRVLLAAAYAELGKTDEAEALFKEALAMKPDYAPALVQYGTLLIALHRDREALEHLRKAAALAPTDAAIKGLIERVVQQSTAHQ